VRLGEDARKSVAKRARGVGPALAYAVEEEDERRRRRERAVIPEKGGERGEIEAAPHGAKG